LGLEACGQQDRRDQAHARAGSRKSTGLLGWFLSRAIVSLQYGVTAADVLTWLPVVAVPSLATLLACWWPARDAMRTDPLALLRED
jgi:hypothetical protein